jgi:hypothetical protein
LAELQIKNQRLLPVRIMKYLSHCQLSIIQSPSALLNRCFQFVMLGLFLPFFSFSQLHWQKADADFGLLPASLHVFRNTDSLETSVVAYYVSAKLKDKDILFTTQTGNGKCLTPSQYFRLEKSPTLVMNCSFFSPGSCKNLSLIIKEGKIVAHNVATLRGIGDDSTMYYYPTRSALGISKNRKTDVAWIFTDSSHRKAYAFENNPVTAKGMTSIPFIYDLNDVEWKWWNMETAVGGGPTLIHDGFVIITNKEEQMFVGEENKKTSRTAIGYTTDNRLIMLVIQGNISENSGGATLQQEAIYLKQLGCFEAINLNGADNSCLLINGKETIKPSGKNGQQPVPAVFVIKHNTQE